MKKGAEMLKQQTKNTTGDFIFSVLDKMVGGAREYFVSTQTVGAIMVECDTNEKLQHLALMYFAGSSERAEKNLANLRAELHAIFLANN
jgi:hypothetical protein